MKVVADTDIVSTFIRINRPDILNKLFDEIIIPPSVKSELVKGMIDVRRLKPTFAKLTKEEIKSFKVNDPRMGRGERECFVIAKHRDIPLVSNDRIVHLQCEREEIDFLSLPRIIRLAILERIVTREQVRQLVKLIEYEEKTMIKDKDSLFG